LKSTDVLSVSKEFNKGDSTRKNVFFIFDIPYLNGESLLHEPLETRYSRLDKVIEPVPGTIEILPYKIGRNVEDLMENLTQHLERGEEGNNKHLINDRHHDKKAKVDL
jgi:ATP-dependent DNA ligase